MTSVARVGCSIVRESISRAHEPLCSRPRGFSHRHVKQDSLSSTSRWDIVPICRTSDLLTLQTPSSIFPSPSERRFRRLTVEKGASVRSVMLTQSLEEKESMLAIAHGLIHKIQIIMTMKLLSIACAALVATTGFSHAGGAVGVRAGGVAVGVKWGGGRYWGPRYVYGPRYYRPWYGPRYYRPWYGPRVVVAAPPVVVAPRVVAPAVAYSGVAYPGQRCGGCTGSVAKARLLSGSSGRRIWSADSRGHPRIPKR
jgi:hypothetical protein